MEAGTLLVLQRVRLVLVELIVKLLAMQKAMALVMLIEMVMLIVMAMVMVMLVVMLVVMVMTTMKEEAIGMHKFLEVQEVVRLAFESVAEMMVVFAVEEMIQCFL